jgi:multidrug efflux pump subunit AcrA (membrane-fusion protein)
MSRALVLLPLLTPGVACSRNEVRTEAHGSRTSVKVQTLVVEPAEIPDAYEATGTVRARYTAAIASKIVGQIREVAVQAGERVKAGQTLIVIDSRDLEAHLRRSRLGFPSWSTFRTLGHIAQSPLCGS